MTLRQTSTVGLMSPVMVGRIVCCITLTTCLGPMAVSQEVGKSISHETAYWDDVFSGKRILQIDLQLTNQAWQSMQPRYGQRQLAGPPRGDQTEFSYARASMTIDGKRLNDVGLRFKGNSSYRSSQRGYKRPFKVDTNRFVKGQKWFGRTKLNLSNSFKDASYLREKLGYEIFQSAGLPATGVGWVQLTLTIDGLVAKQDLGIYVLVEQVDDDWIQRELGSKSANSLLMKPEGFFEWPHVEDSLEAYGIKEGKKNTLLRKRFVAFLQLLKQGESGEFAEKVDQYLDLDNWAQYFAANTILVNLDSIVAMPHNYYLLVDQADGRIKILPWDLNECFGLFSMGANPQELVRWDIERPWVMENRLLQQLFGVPEFKKRYMQAVRNLLDSAFQVDQINRRIAELQPRLETLMKESGRTDEIRQMREAIEGMQSSGESFRGRLVGLKYFVKERSASVQRQLAGTEEGVRLQRPNRRGGPGRPPFGAPPGRGPGGPLVPGIAVIETLDVDHNGVLSADEIRQATVRLRRLDRNGDGKLSPSEYEFKPLPGGEGADFPRRSR